jgi:hypothetical protein
VVAGPSPSSEATTARATCWPIQNPEPASPSSQPDPPFTVWIWPSEMRAAIVPVPAITA